MIFVILLFIIEEKNFGKLRIEKINEYSKKRINQNVNILELVEDVNGKICNILLKLNLNKMR